jgi:TRAP-type C4-dicarboxylate transport system substrate-binding protein
MSRPWVAIAALLAVLLVAWIPDFRYSLTTRSDHADDTAPWYIVVNQWHRLCEESTTGTIFVRQVDGQPVPQHLKCSEMKF